MAVSSITAWSARALMVATALLGAFFAVALKGTAQFISYDADKLWLALVSQHFFLESFERNRSVLSHLLVQEGGGGEAEIRKTKDLSASSYDWTKSTEDNHKSNFSRNYGKFAAIRDTLDKRFHATYSRSRQRFQDAILDSMLETTHVHDVENGRNCSRPERPWIVFSAGAMGAGKTWTVRLLDAKGRFPLHSFVTVDPDQIRQHLPEFEGYVERCPLKAGELTRKEAGMMAEILTKAALQQGKNVLVDGSLRNATWYQSYFQELRQDYKNIRIAIFHVTAPRDLVLSRALSRSKVTGRVVPHDLLERTIDEVPASFAKLKHQVDFAVELFNAREDSSDVELVGTNMDWHMFRRHWGQVCPHHHQHPHEEQQRQRQHA